MTGRDEDARLNDVLDAARAATIAKLNDQLRAQQTGGRLYVTSGVTSLGRGALPAILDAVRSYDRFDSGNDPYGEHDFGAFEHGGTQLFWKIDYYDQALRYASPDPADPSVTTRVLTVMLAEEW